MTEIIDFAKAKRDLGKELKLVLSESKKTENLAKKCNKNNQLEDSGSSQYTSHRIDDNTTVNLFKDGGYWIQKFYPEGKPC